MLAAARILRHIGRAPELIAAGRHTPAVRQLVQRYLGVGAGDYPFTVPLTGGGSLTVSSPAEVRVFWHIFVRGSYQVPARCDTILDCGANVGIFSVWAARQRPAARIVALEPFPDTYASLVANIRANALDDRVRCVPLALAAQAGERFIGIDGASPDRKLVAQDLEADRSASVRVDTLSLGDAMSRNGFDHVDYLKMDIEGSEWEVLLSTPVDVLRRIRVIQLEYHEVHARFGYTPERLFSYLADAGHRLTYRTEDELRTGLAYFEQVA